MSIGNKITTPNFLRQFRLEAGLTQGEVALLLDFKNIGRISEWENGFSNPSIDHLLSLSIIYQRLESQIYYEKRRALVEKISVRRKFLDEKRVQERRLDKYG